MSLGERRKNAIVIATLVALALHGTAAARTALIPIDLIAWSQHLRGEINARLTSIYELDITPTPPTPEPPPPPKVEEEKEPPPPKAEPQPPPPAPVKETNESKEPPPPAAAQAGAVLTKEADPDEPVDLTDSVVSGSGSTFAGGVTQAAGTSTKAVYNTNARANGTPGATGQPGGTAGPDRTRAAARSGGADWNNCPFPPEADSEQIDDAYVTLQVTVKPDGTPGEVAILSDPGHGFGREARACALRDTYSPALDRDGNAIAGKTKPIRVHFER